MVFLGATKKVGSYLVSIPSKKKFQLFGLFVIFTGKTNQKKSKRSWKTTEEGLETTAGPRAFLMNFLVFCSLGGCGC